MKLKSIGLNWKKKCYIKFYKEILIKTFKLYEINCFNKPYKIFINYNKKEKYDWKCKIFINNKVLESW